MKTLSIILVLTLSGLAFADELTVSLEQDQLETSVVVTPLEEAPAEIPATEIPKVEHKDEKEKEKKAPPRWWKISLLGLGLAPVEFFISTALHEGSHALSAHSAGAEILGYHPYPHKHEGMPFRFGDVHWRGQLTPGERALTLAAPMFLDTAVIGTYGGLLLGKALPENRYAHMAIWVFAAGHWIDLANHIIARNEHTDTRRIEKYFQDQHGLTVTQSRLAVRGSQALVLAAGGYFLYKGFRQIFKDTVKRPAYTNFEASMTPRERRLAEEKKRKKKNFIEKHELYLSPSGSADGMGLMFGGRF